MKPHLIKNLLNLMQKNKKNSKKYVQNKLNMIWWRCQKMMKNTKEREVINMFEKFLKRSSWTDITIALVFVLLGVLLIAKPTEMMSVISILLGAVFIIMGFLRLVDYFTSEPKEDYRNMDYCRRTKRFPNNISMERS